MEKNKCISKRFDCKINIKRRIKATKWELGVAASLVYKSKKK